MLRSGLTMTVVPPECRYRMWKKHNTPFSSNFIFYASIIFVKMTTSTTNITECLSSSSGSIWMEKSQGVSHAESGIPRIQVARGQRCHSSRVKLVKNSVIESGLHPEAMQVPPHTGLYQSENASLHIEIRYGLGDLDLFLLLFIFMPFTDEKKMRRSIVSYGP